MGIQPRNWVTGTLFLRFVAIGSSQICRSDAQGAKESKLPIEIVAGGERHHKTVRDPGPTLLNGLLERAPMSTRAVAVIRPVLYGPESPVPYQPVRLCRLAASRDLKYRYDNGSPLSLVPQGIYRTGAACASGGQPNCKQSSNAHHN